nr:hypothetical protein [Tanacetum cinerariifolium]
IDNIDYVEASPPYSELVSSEVMEIVISEVGGINDDILLIIKDDILREKLLNINLLITKIKALNDNPTPSSDFMYKSSSTSLNSLLEETNNFDNSLLKFETFCFDMEEISNGSTTTSSDISLPEYKAFYDDHVKEISSGSTTTHSDSSLYDLFIFDLSINPFPPIARSIFISSLMNSFTSYLHYVTPSLSTDEPDNSLSMGDENLDTILATKSDEFIKSSVVNLIPILNQVKDLSESNKKFSSIDDDSFSIDDIDYVEASPPDSELVNSELKEIVIPEVGGIDDDILLMINHDDLREK